MIDCIIVGVTFPGLILGALLVKEGRKVMMLERQEGAGGRISFWQRDGFFSLQGIPRVRYGENGPFFRICKRLDLDPLLVPMNQAWILDTDEKLKPITVGKPGILRAEFISPWDRFSAWRIMRGLRKEGLDELEDVSLEEWFVKNKVRSSLQKYFHAIACEATHCSDLDLISAGETLRCFLKAYQARSYLAYPRKGWQEILESLQDQVVKNGEIRWRTKVDQVEVAGGRVTGVKVNGETILANSVICATPCQQMVEILPESAATKEYVQLCKKAVPSAALIMDIALKRRIFQKKGLMFFLDPPSYGTFLSNLSYRHAPPGKQLATFICPCTQQEAKQPRVIETLEKKIEANLRKALPKGEIEVEWKRSRVVRMLDSVAIQVGQTRKDRPGCSIPQTKGLYLVGDSTCAPGACWEMEFESVLAAYERIIKERD